MYNDRMKTFLTDDQIAGLRKLGYEPYPDGTISRDGDFAWACEDGELDRLISGSGSPLPLAPWPAAPGKVVAGYTSPMRSRALLRKRGSWLGKEIEQCWEALGLIALPDGMTHGVGFWVRSIKARDMAIDLRRIEQVTSAYDTTTKPNILADAVLDATPSGTHEFGRRLIRVVRTDKKGWMLPMNRQDRIAALKVTQAQLEKELADLQAQIPRWINQDNEHKIIADMPTPHIQNAIAVMVRGDVKYLHTRERMLALCEMARELCRRGVEIE